MTRDLQRIQGAIAKRKAADASIEAVKDKQLEIISVAMRHLIAAGLDRCEIKVEIDQIDLQAIVDTENRHG